jgi:tetratricopeptide (TPR) repeat protein
MTKTVCFVLAPFGVKPDCSGRAIDFDRVHREIFEPAIERAGLLPVRADEARSHEQMCEGLLIAEYAIVDLTLQGANFYFQLGVRHAARPATTVPTMAGMSNPPFEVTGPSAFAYSLDADGKPIDAAGAAKSLAERLKACIARDLVDSPLYRLVDAAAPPPIDRERTDVFRERAAYSPEAKTRLADARAENTVAAIDVAASALGEISGLEAGVVVDVLLSYRAVGGYERMIDLAARMDRVLARTILVREQLAFAQNRLGRSREAEETLKQIIEARGPSSETNGLLGRVYKDRWEAAAKAGKTHEAKALLEQAIDAYLEGFEADIRDAYPGINAVTLMEIAGDPRRHALAPVVRYAAERRLVRKGRADYWDYATRLELALLANDELGAADALGDALAHVRERWELETTARNLRFIADARAARGNGAAGAGAVLAEFLRRIEHWPR